MVQAVASACLDCGASATGIALKSEPALARCTSCRVVFAQEWAEGFDHELYDYYAERAEWPEEDLYLPLTDKRIGDVLRWLATMAPGRRLLDVGCGEGQLVRVASREGWAAKGIDLSESAVAICRRFGLDCEVQDLFSPDLDSARFDVVTMSEFVEHVPGPSRFLARGLELLAAGGILYVTTPNFDSLGRRLLAGEWRGIDPGHIAYFTPKTLVASANRVGLHPVSIFTKNLSVAAVQRLVGRRPAPTTPSTPGARIGEGFAQEQALRHQLESSRLLRAGKATANAVLRLTGLGETIVAVFRAGR